LDRSTSQATGPVESARALGATLMAMLRVRVELFDVELKEAAERHKRMVVLGVVAAVFLALSLLLIAFIVVVFFWDTHRLRAIGAVTLLYAGIGTWALLRLKEAMRDNPPPFSATLGELQKDLDCLRGSDG
jgi:uncharacterized membrane protein YqjE